jgi:alanine racemase
MASGTYAMSDLAQAAGAELLGRHDANIRHLLTDSRRLIFPLETVFFALKTPSNDGHRYIAKLYQQGVRAFVVNAYFDASEMPQAAFLVVDDVLQALQKIAAYHRSQYTYPVVGITGSNGKTVIKEWLFQLLQTEKKVVRSPRSYNSQIGVPLSLWQMQASHELALIEAGISQVGEMDKLEAMIKPNIGIFSNLGHAHDQGFDNWKAKAAEKARLFAHAGKIIYCRDHEIVHQALMDLTNGDHKRLLAWSTKEMGEALPVSIDKNAITIGFANQSFRFTLPPDDALFAENAVHALVCAWHLGVRIEALQNEVKHLQSVEMRLEERKAVRGNLLINDFYNSDPESVRIALELLMQQPAERNKVAVISEYEGLRTGEKISQYKQLVAVLNSLPLQQVILVGGDWADHYAGIMHSKQHFQSTAELQGKLNELNWQNSAILLKGARRFHFEEIAQQLQEQMHQTWLEVDLSAMAHNLRYYRSKLHPHTKVMAMVKALSYGTGTTEIGRWLQYNQVDYLSVAYVDEGIALRKGGINLPIMVINPGPESLARLITFRLEPEIHSVSRLRQFIKVVEQNHTGEEPYPIHIKLETGMHRLGMERKDMHELVAVITSSKAIRVASVFSHLAASDDPAHDAFTREQIGALENGAAKLTNALGYQPLLHIANTSGISRFPSAQLDMVRLGIGLYGAANAPVEQAELKTVLRWYARISQIKQLQAGESVGYGRSFVTEKPTRIATLPVGYADGFFRSLSNGVGQVFATSKKVPVVGKVCMDMIMVDVTGLDIKEGDVVEILGENCTVSEMAEAAQTIPYEIFTHISARVPRVYVSE